MHNSMSDPVAMPYQASAEAPARGLEEEATAAPQRNFSLPTDERVRALVSGPPAFVRRLRAIEDLEEAILDALVEKASLAALAGLNAEDEMRWAFPSGSHDKLGDLVARHNRYYPIEANLPTRTRTGEVVDRDGGVWRPRRCLSMDEFIARALRTARDLRPPSAPASR
jgi:hypothetical protein